MVSEGLLQSGWQPPWSNHLASVSVLLRVVELLFHLDVKQLRYVDGGGDIWQPDHG